MKVILLKAFELAGVRKTLNRTAKNNRLIADDDEKRHRQLIPKRWQSLL
jgi:hypothetical protein